MKTFKYSLKVRFLGTFAGCFVLLVGVAFANQIQPRYPFYDHYSQWIQLFLSFCMMALGVYIGGHYWLNEKK